MQLKKVKPVTAKAVAADITLGEEATLLIGDSTSPAEFLEQLMASGLYHDAIRFLARALPARESAWWACVSARHGVSEQTGAKETRALELAEQWVFKPSTENRHLAHDAVESVDNNSPIHWAGMAVLWSGGSMMPSDLPEVPAEPHLCGLAVSGAVILAGLSDDVAEATERYELFLKQGIAIANGSNAREVV